MNITIPSTMKAAFLPEFKSKLIIKETPVPEPKPTEVLIKVLSSPINPSDLSRLSGNADPSIKLPIQGGTEGYGTVIKAGDPSSEHLIGKNVAWYNFANPSSWAEYTILPSWALMETPSDITKEQGACIYLNPLTCLGLVDNVKKGGHKAVVITTASSCSKILFRLFKAEGISTIAIVRKDEQKQLCLDNEASYALNSTDSDFEKNLAELATKIGATACIECVLGDLLTKLIKALPNRSLFLIYGKMDETSPKIELDFLSFLVKEHTIKSYVWVYWLFGLTPEEKEAVFKKIKNGVKDIFKTDVLKSFKLEEFNEAHEYYLANMSKGKVIIEM